METYEKQSKPKAYRKTPPPTDRCQAVRNNEKLIESVRDTWNGMRSYENLWKSMEGHSWQSMDINGNCHNSLGILGCPRKRVDISYNKRGAERWGQTNVVVFNEPDTIASQPAPPHRYRPTAGVPDVPGPGSGEAGRSQRSMIIMDGYDPLCRCAQLIIGAAWAYSAPAVGLPQTPRAPCPNEKAWKTLKSENNTWNDSRNIRNCNKEKLKTIMEAHVKRPNTIKNTKSTNENSEDRTEWKT